MATMVWKVLFACSSVLCLPQCCGTDSIDDDVTFIQKQHDKLKDDTFVFTGDPQTDWQEATEKVVKHHLSGLKAEQKDTGGLFAFLTGGIIETFNEIFKIVMEKIPAIIEEPDWTAKEATDVPYVWYEGAKKMYLPIGERQGFALEYLYSMKVAENGMKVNESHLWIPFHRTTPIQANFVKKGAGNETEKGIANWIWWAQKGSIMSAETRVGAFEKVLSFSAYEDGEKPVNLSMPTEALPKPGYVMGHLVKLKRLVLNLMVMASQGHGQTARAAGMPNQDIRNAATADGGTPGEAFAHSAASMREQLPSKEAPVYHSETNCFHMEFGTKIPDYAKEVKLADVHGIWVPLNTKLVAYKGQNFNTPHKAFEINQGIVVWTYDGKGDRAEALYASSLVAHLGNPWVDTSGGEYDSATKTEGDGITVSSPDGVSGIVKVQPNSKTKDGIGYTPLGKLNRTLAAFLGTIARYLPGDPNYLFQPSHVICPNSTSAASNIASAVNRSSSLQKIYVAWALTEAAGCVKAGIAPVTNDPIEYDIGIATAYLHACQEIPAVHLFSTAGSPGLSLMNESLI